MRVLEIGCGDGMNVVGMAASTPELTGLGLDVWDEALGRGRAVIAELGLGNVQLRTADVRAAGDPGEHDFVIAHGVYSWTPPDVREAALALAARSLAPHGVAFVSFLCHPGGFLRTMVREIGLLAEEPEAIYGELLELVRGRPDPYARAVEFELQRIRSRPYASLVHDDLAESYAPVWLKDFEAHAASQGLRRLCEADPAELRPGWMPAEVAARLEGLDPLARDQMADVIAGRAYREAVLCRSDAPVAALDLAALDAPLPVRHGGGEVFPLAKLQARAGTDVTNLRHEQVRLTPELRAALLAGEPPIDLALRLP
jgi:SAM-dependent methyltransferase